MSRYHEIAEELIGMSEELCDDAQATDFRRQRRLLASAHRLQAAAEELLELDLGPELTEEVLALQALCRCGHDKGDHLIEAPHLCECPVTWILDERICPCAGFRPAHRDTMPDLMTEPAPAPEGAA